MRARNVLYATVPLFAALSIGAVTAQAANSSDAASSAQDRVNDAVKVVHQMKQDPGLSRLLARADGIFIVSHYGRGAFIVGGQGGGGVVLVRHDGTWTDPAFYNIGGGSVGLQAGGAGGSIAMILMSNKAVHKFENSTSTWSLNAGAGLTVVTYSGRAQANSNNGDVVLWSNTKGLYGGLTAGVTDITPDTRMDHVYYRGRPDSRQILMGSVKNPDAGPLRNALSMHVAER
ncbi:MAG TPA: lipid-binding SYLF domain-containing protein [Steroidobacteraceae bacterium]|nr:lipid-binding SYLF domain-containing protein [Steroidobacteraceae bacterium]